MAILTRNITAVDSSSGFTGATFANLSTIDGTVATSTAPAGGTITMSLADAPGDYSSLNSLTLTVRARTNASASRAKSILVELLDTIDGVITSYTTSSLTTTLVTYTSGALTPSLTAAQLTDARLRITVQEAGGMGDSVTTSVDYAAIEINYNTLAPQIFQGSAVLAGTGSLTANGTRFFSGASALSGSGSLTANGTKILGPVVEPWSLLGATWIQNIAVGAQDNNPQDIFIDATGTRVYIPGRTNIILEQWSMSTPWDISTLTHVRNFSLSTEGTIPTSVYFKPDGTEFYVTFVDTDVLAQYHLSTAWDISTATIDSTTSIATDAPLAQSLFITPDGTKAFIGTYSGTVEDYVVTYTMSPAWDASTISFSSQTQIGTSIQPTGVRFSSDGMRMFVSNIETLGEFDDSIIQFELTTAYDPSTATQTQDLYVGDRDLSIQGIHFSPNGTKLYTVGGGSDRVQEYTLFVGSTLQGAAALSATGTLTANGTIAAAAQEGAASLTATSTLVANGTKLSTSLVETGVYNITGFAPALARTVLTEAVTGTYNLSGFAPSLTRSLISGAVTGTYTLTGYAPTLSETIVSNVDTGVYNITGFAPTNLFTRVTDAPTGSYSITGFAPDISIGAAVFAETGTYTLTGFAPSTVKSSLVNAETGVYEVSSTPPTLTRTLQTNAPTGSYTLTGQAPETIASRLTSAPTGVYTLTGQAPATEALRFVNAETGVYTLSGNAPTTVRSLQLEAVTGTYTVTGYAPLLEVGALIVVPTGVYNINAFLGLPTFTRSLITNAPTISYNITGGVVNLVQLATETVFTPESRRISRGSIEVLPKYVKIGKENSLSVTFTSDFWGDESIWHDYNVWKG